MGSDRNERGLTTQRGNGKGRPKNTRSRMHSFHPTEGEKEILRVDDTPTEDYLTLILEKYCQGATLTLGKSDRTDAFYATIRERTDDWEAAYALSAFHSDPVKALRSLGYALAGRYALFPDLGKGVTEKEYDW